MEDFECPVCGYVGSYEEFCEDDEDTKCPICGEDVQIFLV